MRAIEYQQPGTLEREEALVDIELPTPVPTGRDILVEVKAVSVNPVDTKVRKGNTPEPGQWKVLGWDAAGIVVAAGPEATLFRRGGEVFYVGTIGRPGANSQFLLVDERMVGHKPKTLGWAEAAAVSLTAFTAWEAMFDRLDVAKLVPGATPAILVVGGAGGVGSIAIQLARALTDLTVIGTASRSETRKWVASMGAPCGGPRQAAGGGSRDARHRRPVLRVLPDPDRASPGPNRRTDRPARPLRLDRRSGDAQRQPVQAQVGLDPPGADVRSFHLWHHRHGRAGLPVERSVALARRRHAADDDDRAVRPSTRPT